MPRSSTAVKRADEELHAAVLDLWTAHRVETGSSPDAAARLAADGAVRAALSRPDVCAYVAFTGDQPVGYVVVTDGSANPFTDNASLVIDELYVVKQARRSGVARLLLAAVATHAERTGTDQIASNVPANGRDAHRFFARLGFLPSTVRRITTTACLLRRLLPDEDAGLPATLTRVRVRRRTAQMRRFQERIQT